MSTANALILPGLGNSGPEHWQSLWERRDPLCLRVQQAEWDAPRCADWITRLAATLERCEQPVVLVAHSAACAMVAHWAVGAAARELRRVRGALLVAPSDPEGANYPREAIGFAPIPLQRLPFTSLVVASTNDPYVDIGRAREYARAWGSRLELLENAGHINVASGFGPWPEGFEWLAAMRADQSREKFDANSVPANA